MVAALLVSGTVVVIGQEQVLESTLARRATALAARATLGAGSVPVHGTPSVRIVGFVWMLDDTPVDSPRLRIRTLQDGQVAARTTGSALGEFRFDRLAGGSYLIELLDPDDRVLAVGHPLFVLPGETVGTFIRMSAQGGAGNGRFDVTGSGLSGGSAPAADVQFGLSAPTVVRTASDAGISAIRGGNAASNER